MWGKSPERSKPQNAKDPQFKSNVNVREAFAIEVEKILANDFSDIPTEPTYGAIAADAKASDYFSAEILAAVSQVLAIPDNAKLADVIAQLSDASDKVKEQIWAAVSGKAAAWTTDIMNFFFLCDFFVRNFVLPCTAIIPPNKNTLFSRPRMDNMNLRG